MFQPRDRVPSKRVKNAHRKSGRRASLRAFAGAICDRLPAVGDPDDVTELRDAAMSWFQNKAA